MAVGGSLGTPIPGPQNGQARGGLLDLAVTEEDVVDEGLEPREEAWVGGFAFLADTCADPQIIAHPACGASVEKVAAGNPDVVRYDPFLVIGSDECSTLDVGRDRIGRARRHLLATQSWAVERVFWTGTAEGDPADVERPSLTDSTATVVVDEVAAVSGRDALALLDQALSDCLHGQQGMIHVTPLLLSLTGADVLRWSGDRWLTRNGHVVVPGAGYTGGGPRPADDGDPDSLPGALPAAPDLLAGPPEVQWAYATPLVHVRLGPVMDFGSTTSRMNRAVNTTTALVERAAAAFHAACCKFGVAIDVGTP